MILINPPLNFVISHFGVGVGGMGSSWVVPKISSKAPSFRNPSKSNNNRSEVDPWLGWESELVILVLISMSIVSMVGSMLDRPDPTSWDLFARVCILRRAPAPLPLNAAHESIGLKSLSLNPSIPKSLIPTNHLPSRPFTSLAQRFLRHGEPSPL